MSEPAGNLRLLTDWSEVHRVFTIIHNGHTIKIQANTTFTAVETVWYDETEVSRHSSLFGSTHDFVVEENGEQAHYEVAIALTVTTIGFLSVTLRRNDALLFSLE